MNSPTHMLPVELAQPRRRGLTLLVPGLLLLVTLLLAVHHYGSGQSLNQGYVLGDETSSIELGYETVGAPGVFGHLTTALGSLDFYGSDGFVWCPAGASDVECGA